MDSCDNPRAPRMQYIIVVNRDEGDDIRTSVCTVSKIARAQIR